MTGGDNHVPGGGGVKATNSARNRVALLVKRYLSNAASFVSSVFRRVKDHYNLLYASPLLNTCVRQVMLDERFPLKEAEGVQL